ncbi:DNA binding regulatory protein AmdX [Niveomyces insectorum RCEF 264]|uniref:DNA binding regulatory protein AmdX n=1 Tax=Niveomyces insectorum RCEF 264 TaxID=1081102 RepID=A0A167WCK8_9HYPO|nr:DNA binding regulatory protein AmdX [Niveomyces insectorum RCEF 264]
MSNASPSPPSEGGVVIDDAGSTITVNTKAPVSASAAPSFPPPKTDKPRPHVCTTCQRSFARLEHLKRHERSHTKEKPFECSQCTRCFARRDLLLRHQQKLHQSTTPAARPRNRRESTTAVTPSRARKNSMASTSGAGSAAAGLGGMSNGGNGGSGGSGGSGSNAAASMRPRANTISHVDATAMHMMSPANVSVSMARGIPPGMHSRHPSLAGLPMHGMDMMSHQSPAFMGMSSVMGHRGMNHGLPKLETNSINGMDFSSGLRTAPVLPLFSPDFDFDAPVFGHGAGTTINPNALHYSDSPQSLALDPTSAFARSAGAYQDMPPTRDSFDWLTGFEHQMSFSSAIEENAIDGSSPSAMSTGSPSGISDVMLDGSSQFHNNTNNNNNNHASTMPPPVSSSSHAIPSTLPMWQSNGVIATPQHMAGTNFSLDMGSTSFSDLLSGLPMSPNAPNHSFGLSTVQAPMNSTGASAPRNGDSYFSTPPPSLSSLSPSLLSNMNPAVFGQSLGLNGGNAPETPNSMNGSNSSVSSNGFLQAHQDTSSPVSTITDATRAAIVNALNLAGSPSSPFGMRKYSSKNGSASPSSAQPAPTPEQFVPSVGDLQRYVGAYLRYFQPHFPFLHVATVSFELPSDSSSFLPWGSRNASGGGNGSSGSSNSISNSNSGGSGCLILSMAAIGALYELEHDQSRTLFSMAKCMIQLYLDERRKANVRKADFRRTTGDSNNHQQQSPHADSVADTPVWLVQAMLLNVVYGHNGSDKRAGEIAATHCAALVSLAQGAELLRPTRIEPLSNDFEVPMSDLIDASNLWGADEATSAAKTAKEEALWREWKTMEERKRTLYAIFTLSSLLVSSYNHTPALTNSEILLDLPCDEHFFAAPTCADFMALGGVAAANHNRMTFHEALGNLLRSSEKQMRRGSSSDPSALANGAANELKPSTFGCFILINALHNYIWETRQRHHNKVWTNEETEKMHRHIEPALQAWQRAWASNPQHATERPNPFGVGALSGDAIPLLDLAYVRLFVNLARSKEKFWQRNWDGLAEELSHGREIVQHAEQSPASNSESALTDLGSDLSGNASVFVDSPATQLSSSPDFGASKLPLIAHAQSSAQSQQQSSRATSRREKHLRKAAFYAADALSMTDKLGFTLADFANRELPIQSALCAFDCAQVLAEWVATLQDRVGRYLGILGHDEVDLGQVPAIMLLEDEDVKLLAKIQEVLSTAEMKMNVEIANGMGTGSASSISARTASRIQMGEVGYAAKIASITAYMLGKAAVWPVIHLMAECLENYAGHVRTRAEKSVVAYD